MSRVPASTGLKVGKKRQVDQPATFSADSATMEPARKILEDNDAEADSDSRGTSA